MFEKLDAPKMQADIVDNWLYTEKVYISIICTTYNQELYIRDAIDSFLAQETEYKFEIVIHDDSSTDSTVEIIKEYQARFPEIVKPILQDKNQFSINVNLPFVNALKASCGEFVALCEGDDFWVERNKLQVQILELIENPDVNLCFHSALEFDGLNSKVMTRYGHDNKNISIESIIEKRYGNIATASSFVRKSALDECSIFLKNRLWLSVGDIYIHLFSSMGAGAICINKPMSVYRKEAEGSWSKGITYKKRLSHINSRIRSYKELNHLTNYRYDNSFKISNLDSIGGILVNKRVPINKRLEYLLNNRDLLTLNSKSLHYVLSSMVPYYLECINYFKD
ncbi:glycosyltransferase [Vibrio cyclitrophicus]|uniref:glycosyltransferase n=1 Tax=Vibrio cyclitrophicus TaxID=47951 RepID=UPI0032E4DECF